MIDSVKDDSIAKWMNQTLFNCLQPIKKMDYGYNFTKCVTQNIISLGDSTVNPGH